KAKSMLGSAAEDHQVDQTLPDGSRILIKLFPEAEPDQLGNFVDEMFRSNSYAVVAAGSLSNGSLAVRVAEGSNASDLFRKFYVPQFEGGGGGRKDFAKGGLKKLKELPPDEALQRLLQATIAYKSQ